MQQHLLASAPTTPTALGEVSSPGIYAWWDSFGALTPFYPASFPPVDATKPIYVGIARTGLNERGLGMHLASTRMSTVRRSLAALLFEELGLLAGLTVSGKGKFSLAPVQEKRLTEWMLEHLTVTWVVHVAPQDVEKQIVGDLLAPFNDIYAHPGPYWQHMRALRSEVSARAAVRLQSATSGSPINSL